MGVPAATILRDRAVVAGAARLRLEISRAERSWALRLSGRSACSVGVAVPLRRRERPEAPFPVRSDHFFWTVSGSTDHSPNASLQPDAKECWHWNTASEL